MAQLVTQSTFPTAATPSMAAVDIEFAPGSRPLNAPSFTTVTGRTRRASVKRGRAFELDRFLPGKLHWTAANRDRLLDASYSANPWATGVRAERQIRGTARYAGVTYPLFGGYLDGVPQVYPSHGKDSVIETDATDLFKVLALADLPNSMYEMAVATDRPTHWWKCSEAAGSTSLADTGFGLTPIAGTPATTTGTLGNTAIVPFDGSRTALTKPGVTQGVAAATLNGGAPVRSTWSVEFWFASTTTVNGTRFLSIYLGSADSGSGGWVRCTMDGSGFFSFQGVTSTAASAGIVSAAGLNDGKGHHALYTWNGATATLYVDGVSRGTITPASGVMTFTSAYSIDVCGFHNSIPAALDDNATVTNVAFYDGQVLTATQAANHYAAGKNAFSGSATGTHVSRILDYIGIPNTARAIATGNKTIGSYELPGGSGLDYLNRLAETEGCQFYVDRSGILTFRGRQAQWTDSRSLTSQATFGDSGAELRYVDVIIDPGNETNLRNDVEISRNGGTRQRVTDAASIEENLRQSYSRTDRLYSSDNDAFDDANWILARYKDPQYRIVGLVINPLADPTNLWPQVLGREIGDRITVNVRPMGVGTVNSQELIIEGIEHDISAGAWITTFRLSQADSQRYWILGDATYGVLGTTTRIAA